MLFFRFEYEFSPLANIGRISGLPQHQVRLLSLNTESNSTGFSFQPWEMDTQIAPNSLINFAAINSQCERSRSCTPTLSNGTDVLIEASDESDMARAGFRGDTSVRHTPGTPLFHHTPGETHGSTTWKQIDLVEHLAHTT